MPLTDDVVMTALTPGRRYSDGDGLYLHVRSTVARSWIMLVTVDGKRREIALGSAVGPGKPGLSLTDARAKADEKRGLHAAGELFKPPTPEPAAPPEVWTFKRVTGAWFADVYEHEVAAKTASDIRSLIDRKAATLMTLDVQHVTSDDVEAVLKPIWRTLNRSATDLRLKLETIFGYAIAKKYRDAIKGNPADWKILQHLLPDATPFVEHHDSVPWKDLPGVMRIVRTKNHTSARALEFATLTAVRPTECRGARVQEIDFKTSVWSIPAARMKVKKVRGKDGKLQAAPDHQVPLSRQAVKLLRAMIPEGAAPEDLIFKGDKPGQMMGMNAMTHTLQRITQATPHGMRASFSTWREEATKFDYRLAEAALAHTFKGESEAAYNRSDMLEKRRPLMQAWADYLDAANVTRTTPN